MNFFLFKKKKKQRRDRRGAEMNEGGAEPEERVVCGHFRRKEKIIKLFFFHGLGEYVIRYGPPVCTALQQSKKEKPKKQRAKISIQQG